MDMAPAFEAETMQVRVLPGGLKFCGTCEETKAVEEFALKNAATGLRQTRCRSCQSVASKAHYAKNKRAYSERNRRRKDEAAAILRAWKSGPCQDCGRSFPPRAMDTHHRQDKIDILSRLVRAGNPRAIERELAKCDLLCAVCHRLRH